jgi:hypothetical protein
MYLSFGKKAFSIGIHKNTDEDPAFCYCPKLRALFYKDKWQYTDFAAICWVTYWFSFNVTYYHNQYL